MTREVIIRAIGYRLKPIDNTGQFHLKFIQSWCDIVWEQKISEYIKNGMTDDHFYKKSFEGVVSEDPESGRNYISLPEKVLSIPIQMGGAVSIHEKDSLEYDFKLTTERDFRLFQKQDVISVNDVDDVYYFYYTKDRIWFDTLPSDLVSGGVSLDLMIPFSSYDIDEDLPIPVSDDYVNSFVNTVVMMIAGTPVPNLNNNNKDV